MRYHDEMLRGEEFDELGVSCKKHYLGERDDYERMFRVRNDSMEGEEWSVSVCHY